MRPKDHRIAEIIPKRVQELELPRFDELRAGDILFVDSSHVSKVGSDVNHIVFEILPRLSHGVFVHFHDIFYPFEYPTKWIEEGRFWNEDYIMRAFLNVQFLFSGPHLGAFPRTFHSERLRERMPLCKEGIGGSLWLQRA